MMSKKGCSDAPPVTVWDGPEPDFKMEFPYLKTGQIPTDIVKQFTDYTKIHHRSDDSLENWTRFDKVTTFDENSKADLVRLALIDVCHQRQFQRRAINIGITSQGWNSIHPEYYTEYYNWMFNKEENFQNPPEFPIQNANIMAQYPSTPITYTDYGSTFSSKTMTRQRIENPTDIDLGFPALLPLGPETNNYSWIASIDRLPAQLFSRKICRRVYETLNKAVIITNLPQSYERKSSEQSQNKRDLADGKEITFKDIGIEGCEVELRSLQDKPRTIDEINDQKRRRLEFKVAKNPHDCYYPLYFWTIPYLANLSDSEVHKIRQGEVLPRQIEAEIQDNPEEKKMIGAYTEPPHPYGECFFRIGETDDGTSLRIRAKMYYQYMLSNKDDSPLYLFESNLYKSRLSSTIPKLFHPPTWLVADLVRDVLPIPRRPPFQWLLKGAKRSGTRVHRDPRGTSAFNASTYGLKRWVLFRSGVPSNVAKGNVVMTDDEYRYRQEYGSPQCSYWFEHVLPRLRRWLFHREQKRRAVLLQLKTAGIYTFAPNGHAICTCNCQDGINRREDRTKRLTNKDYAPIIQNQVSFLCECQCLCGCKLSGMTQCGIDLNQIDLRMDPCTTADDSFGTSPHFIPQSLLDLEKKLEDEDYTQVDTDGLTIQQQIDLLLAKHLALKDGPVQGSGTPQWDELRDGYGFQEFIQYPHETIIVPSNLLHAVINITDTIAITENYANSSNTHVVYRSMRTHNKSSTRRWLTNLNKQGSPDAKNWVQTSTNDGRNVEEPMNPLQRASWFRRWSQLLQEIHEFDGAKPLSKHKPSKRPKQRESDLTSTDDSQATVSCSTTEPEPWLSTDEDDM